MPRWLAVSLCALVAGGLCTMVGCAVPNSPVAPDSSLAGGAVAEGTVLTADQVAIPPEARASVRGQIRLLNQQRGVFAVASAVEGRAGAQWVKVETRTIIWTFDGTRRVRLRLASLKNGMVVEVRGIDRERFILALNVAVRTRD